MLNGKLQSNPMVGRFVRGGAWLLGGGAIATILNGLTGILLARHLGVEFYGIIALISSTVLLIAGLVSLRTTESVTKFLIEFIEVGDFVKSRAIVQLSLLIDFLSAVLCVCLLYFLSAWLVPMLFGDQENLKWFQLYSVVPFLVFCYPTSLAVLRASDKFSLISLTEVIYALVSFVGTVTLVYLKLGWQEFIILHVSAYAVRGVVLIFFIHKGLRTINLSIMVKVTPAALVGELRDVLRLMGTTSLTFILKTTHTHIDTFLVGMLAGPAGSGTYKFAKNIIQILAFPTNALFQLSYPEFVRLLNDREKAKFKKVVRVLFLGTLGLALVYCIATWLLAPLLIPLLVGEEYNGSVSLFPILVVGLSLTLISQYWHAALVAVNRAGQVVYSMFYALLAQIFILLTLLPIYGLEMAAASFVIYSAVRAVFLFYRFKTSVLDGLE
jgi:O-antigen/teichoic acid export membrane protein